MKTEYDYLVEKRPNFMKEALAKGGIAMVNGELKFCKDVYCDECDFTCYKNNGEPCYEVVKEWLEKERIVKPLPCPFCGSDDVKIVPNILDSKAVECQKCFASIAHFNTEEEAIEAWNRRV